MSLEKRLVRISCSALLLVVGATAPACDGDPPATTPVADLSDAEARSLCEEFYAAACGTILDAGDIECTTCQPCAQATSLATIRAECGAGITVAGVRHCINSGFDMPTCTGPERGGCMFDVGDALCPVPPTP